MLSVDYMHVNREADGLLPWCLPWETKLFFLNDKKD